MLIRQNPIHVVDDAPTYLATCVNCNNPADLVLVYCKEGIGVSPPIVNLFTDRFTAMPKVYYLQCPICGHRLKLAEDVVTILTSAPSGTNGWHPDPCKRHQRRYWDGSEWTTFVFDNNRVSINKVDEA